MLLAVIMMKRENGYFTPIAYFKPKLSTASYITVLSIIPLRHVAVGDFGDLEPMITNIQHQTTVTAFPGFALVRSAAATCIVGPHLKKTK